MITHLEAVREKISLPAVGADRLFLWSVPDNLKPPYVILSVPADASGGLRLSGVRDQSFDVPLRVKVVSATPESVSIILSQIKAQIVGLLMVPGWECRIRWTRSDFIYVDDPADPDISLSPNIGVDTYQLISRPGV